MSTFKVKSKKKADSSVNENIDTAAENKKGKLSTFLLHGTRYKTYLSKKFSERKPYSPPDPKKVITVIPGTIKKINVTVGQKVRQGDELLILEAMKMQNRIVVLHEGVVKSIPVKEGDRVAKGTVMIEFK